MSQWGLLPPFGVQWQQVRSILSDHWHILTRSDTPKAIVGDRMSMVAKRARNLKDDLVESEFKCPISRNWLTDLPMVKGMHPCGHCGICKFVERTTIFHDSESINEYTFKSFINCSTSRVLYILECPCHKLYVGKTKHQLQVRFAEHLKSIRLKEKTRIAQHFLKFHQWSVSGLSVKGFFALNLSDRRRDYDTVLMRKERLWIFRLQTLQPKGLNVELSLKVFLEA